MVDILVLISVSLSHRRSTVLSKLNPQSMVMNWPEVRVDGENMGLACGFFFC